MSNAAATMASSPSDGLPMFCRGCAYPLHGLPSRRCPECGQGFNPEDPRTFLPAPRRPLPEAVRRARAWLGWGPVPAGLAILFTWLCAFVGFCSPLVVAAPAVLVLRRRWVSLAAAVLLSPVGVSALDSAWGYATGRGYLVYSGYPGPQFHNLDPDLRCPRRSAGCIVTGGEWLWQSPHNGTMAFLTRLLGPQPGAYTGPYPTEAEALGTVQAGQPITLAQLTSDAVPVAGQTRRLDPGVGRELLRRGSALWLLDSMQAMGTDVTAEVKALGDLRAGVWRNRCLIVSLPQEQRSPGVGGGPAATSADVAVIDLATGRPFAWYPQGDVPNWGAAAVPWRK